MSRAPGPDLPPFGERLKALVRRLAAITTPTAQQSSDLITIAEAARLINRCHDRCTRLAEAVLLYDAESKDAYAGSDAVKARYNQMTILAREIFK